MHPSHHFGQLQAMEQIQNAKIVHLKSAQDKYLTAAEDQESVTQERRGFSKSAKWTIEFVDDSDSIIRLKSSYGKYLTASNKPFIFGMSGRKVLQTIPKRLDSSVEWRVIGENGYIKLKAGNGQFLRANGGLPPWRNSVTHDVPHRTTTQEWILWEVHVVEVLDPQSPLQFPMEKSDSFSSETSSSSSLSANFPASFSWIESRNSFAGKSPKGDEGRLIYFHIADENGEIDQTFEELRITFNGNCVQNLTKRLEWELGIDGITICNRSPLNGLLYPLRLQLPPNNAPMHIVVLPASPQVDSLI